MFASHLGWLHSVAKDQKELRISSIVEPNYPDVSGCELIIGWFTELGMAQDGQPISFSEINAWSQITATSITHWHAKLLREMSVNYISEQKKAANKTDLESPAPFAEYFVKSKAHYDSIEAKLDEYWGD